jgi:hypothetical protein
VLFGTAPRLSPRERPSHILKDRGDEGGTHHMVPRIRILDSCPASVPSFVQARLLLFFLETSYAVASLPIDPARLRHSRTRRCSPPPRRAAATTSQELHSQQPPFLHLKGRQGCEGLHRSTSLLPRRQGCEGLRRWAPGLHWLRDPPPSPHPRFHRCRLYHAS